MKKVACFFTGGWTEINAMKLFLEKINKNVEYIQFCPTGEKKRKTPFKRELGSGFSGLTSKKLDEYVDSYLEKYKDRISECDAVLVEDDLDDKYISLYDEKDYIGKISDIKAKYNKDCEHRRDIIRSILGKEKEFPVILLHAAPEVEAWFYADWNNTFGYIYGPKVQNVLPDNMNDFFSISFKKYLEENVLCEYREQIELYGSFAHIYKKLSEELIKALYVPYRNDLDIDNEDIIELIKDNRELSYSKKIEGQIMLMYLNPKALERKCDVYFRDTMYQIQGI